MKIKGFGTLLKFKPRRYFRRGYLPLGGGPGTRSTVLAGGS